MSWISWVFTSNGLARLPEPLLSRCRIVQVADIAIADLLTFARTQGAKRGLSEASIAAISDALERTRSAASRPNLRVVARMLDRARILERRTQPH